MCPDGWLVSIRRLCHLLCPRAALRGGAIQTARRLFPPRLGLARFRRRFRPTPVLSRRVPCVMLHLVRLFGCFSDAVFLLHGVSCTRMRAFRCTTRTVGNVWPLLGIYAPISCPEMLVSCSRS